MIQMMTAAVLTVTAVMWLAVELWLVFTHQEPISLFMKDGAVKFMFVPYGWGVLTAHFFMTYDMRTVPFGDKAWWWMGWALLAVGIILSDVFLSGTAREALPSWLRILRTPYMMLLVGMAAGFLFWPQRVNL